MFLQNTVPYFAETSKENFVFGEVSLLALIQVQGEGGGVRVGASSSLSGRGRGVSWVGNAISKHTKRQVK